MAPPSIRRSTRPLWVAAAAFLATGLVSGLLVWRSEQQRLGEARARVADMAGDHAQALQRGIERALSATYAMAALVRQGNGAVRDFEAVATQMLPFYPGAASLSLSPGGVIRQVVPLAGNEGSLGFNQLQDAAQNTDAQRARDTGQLTLAGPLQLVQGGLGAVGRLPVFLDDPQAGGVRSFWGFTNVTIRFPQALEAARLTALGERGYSYELWRRLSATGARQTIATSGAMPPVDPVERGFELPNGTWVLSVSPARGWSEPLQLWSKAALGLLVSALMANLARLLVRLKEQERNLEADVAARTAEIQATQKELERLAHYDALTGLPNRTLLADRSQHAISIAQRNGSQLALLFLDLDHFKNINDSLGHRVGDRLLVALAERLTALLREQDTVARLGGDEFILVLPGTDADGAAHVATKLLEAALQPYALDHYELTITPSIGIALYPADGPDFDTLSKCADAAMYRAKQDGRNSFRFFTPEMQAQSARALQLENALRRALEREQFTLHFQPQVSLASGAIVGAETLLRWHHPELGNVSPAEFIPVAEESGLILPIGEWVLRSAVRQLKAWLDAGLPAITLSVNLSAVQFRLPHLPELVTRILQEAGLPAQHLELELTEGAAMDDPRAAISTMDLLHQRGIAMSIDDFGTGYSSLSYLKRFQVGKLKIDQSFVRDITVDPEDKAIVSAIISMAGALGLRTVAEGVETEGQLAFLRQQGCQEGQGYLFSKPLPAADFERFWRGKTFG